MGGKPPDPRMLPGNIHTTNNCGDLEILNYVNKREVTVRFKQTGSINTVYASQIQSGELKDPMLPTICDRGYLGIGPYNSKKHRSAYTRWTLMLKRCYDPTNQDYKTYGSIGVYVCSNLYNFQVYAWWYYQECARLGIDSENNNYHVDKDILCNHYGFTTPFYSLDTICLISNTVNSIEAQAEYWLFTSPQGKPETIYNLSKFCKENGLSYGRMLSVYSDTQKSHRGWTKT